MNNQRNSIASPADIDVELFTQLFEVTPNVAPSAEASARIKHKLMQRIASQDHEQFFVFAGQGDWKTLGPGMDIKVLHRDKTSRSFLLKLAENTSIPYHDHRKNEETFVVNGEVWLDGVFCSDGDYHFASAGTFHKEIRTERGCTLLIKTS